MSDPSDAEIRAEMDRRGWTATPDPQAPPDNGLSNEDVMAELKRRYAVGQTQPLAAPISEQADAFVSHAIHSLTSGIIGAPGELQRLGDRLVLGGDQPNTSPSGLPRYLPSFAQADKFLQDAPHIRLGGLDIPIQAPEADPQGATLGGRLGDYAAAGVAPGGPLVRAGRIATARGGHDLAQGLAKMAGANDAWQEAAGLVGAGGGLKAGESTVRPLASAGDNLAAAMFNKLPLPNKSALGMSGGNLFAGPGAGSAPPKPAPITEKVYRRNGIKTPEDFDAAVAPYNEQGVTPPTFLPLGKGAHTTLGAAAALPGETATAAEAQLTPYRRDMQKQALAQVNNLTGAPQQSEASAAATEARDNAGKAFGPALSDATLDPAGDVAAEKLLAQRVDPKDFEAIEKQALKNWRATGHQGEPNDAQFLHFIKQGLWDHAEDLSQNPRTAPQGAGYKQTYHALSGILNDAIKTPDGQPTYGQLNDTYSKAQSTLDSIKGGYDAMGGAGGWNGLDTPEFDAAFSKLHPEAQAATRTGMATFMRSKIEGQPLGSANAGRVADTLGQTEKLGVAFPPDAVSKFVQQQGLLQRDAAGVSRVLNNSESAGRLAHGLGMAGDAGGLEIPHSPLEWPGAAVKHIGNMASSGLFEAYRDRLGKELLEPLTKQRQSEIRSALSKMNDRERAALLAQALAAHPAPSSDQQSTGGQ